MLGDRGDAVRGPARWRALARPAGHRIAWALGFALFAGGSAAEAYGASYGWREVAFRLYYLLGGVLAVALLGLGSAWLHLPRSWSLVLTGRRRGLRAGRGDHACSPHRSTSRRSAWPGCGRRRTTRSLGLAFLWAVFLNSAGTLLLVGRLAALPGQAARA